MKKFILAALASAMLFPTSAFATEMEEVNVYEEMVDEEVALLESSPTSTTIVFKVDATTQEFKKTLYLSEESNENLVRLYYLLPDGYHFKENPSGVNATNNSFVIVPDTNYTPSNKSDSAPIYLQYKVSESDNNPFTITFNSRTVTTSTDPLITIQEINDEIQKISTLYKTDTNVYSSELKAIYVNDTSANSMKPIAYILTKPRTLSKEIREDLADETIKVKFGNNSGEFELRIGNFKPDANGNFKIDTGTLKIALEELTKDEAGKVIGNSTFEVVKVTNDKTNAISLNAYTIKDTINLPHAQIVVGYTNSTPIYLKMQTSGGATLVDWAMATYGDLVATSGNDKGSIVSDKVNSFVKNNYGRLSFTPTTFSPIKVNYNLQDADSKIKSNDDFKKIIDFNTKNTPQNITVSTDGTSYDVLKKSPYKITFKDSTTDVVIETENRNWNDYFQGAAQSTLTRKDITSDFLPSPSKYRVAEKQTPKSTADTKKKPADGNGFTLSIYQTNAVIYFTSMSNNNNNNGGGSTTDKEDPTTPTTPDTPDTPTTPEQPTIPSQGRSVMYRVYNPHTHEHLYTQDVGERDKLLASGWNDEGHGWTAPAISSYKVYRVFNPNSGEHHYTMDQNEYDTLISYGWTGEGTAFFSANDVDNKVTLYRLYHPNAPESAKHHYTMDENERNDMIAEGWIPEGTAWYGLPN